MVPNLLEALSDDGDHANAETADRGSDRCRLWYIYKCLFRGIYISVDLIVKKRKPRLI